MIIALLVALIAVVLTRDNDSEADPATTEVVLQTTAGTTPATTVAPATTAPPESTPETTTPETTAPPTTAPASVEITTGQAVLVSDGKTQKFSVAATCSDFWAGVQTTSHVLVDNETKHVWVVDVFASEEGGDRGMQAIDMNNAIASNIFGLDAPPSPTYSGTIDDSEAGVARSTLRLTTGQGPDSVVLSVGEPSTVDDCAVGSFTPQSPFVSGRPVQWQSPDDTTGQRYNLLADCGGELLVTGGGLLLTTYPQDGSTMAAGLVNSYNLTGSEVSWTNLVTPDAAETVFEQGGDGDTTAAINVFPDGDRTAPPGYLAWAERPLRSVVGASGLLDDVCTASP
jgi:hypothetical protein